MFQHILVPLDGSSRAERALPVAARIARISGGSLILVRVIDIVSELAWQLPEAPVNLRCAIDTERTNAIDYLAEVVTSSVLAGLDIVTEVAEGKPAEMLLSVAQTRRADLIVMSSHGYTGLKRWLLGSVAQYIERHSPTPILILRGNELLVHPDLRPTRVLVPLNGTALAEAILPAAAQLSRALSFPLPGMLHLAVVQPQSHQTTMATTKEYTSAIHEAQRYLVSIMRRLRQDIQVGRHVEITSSVSLQSNAHDALIELAAMGANMEGVSSFTGYDVIALATRNREGIDRWFHPDVAAQVLDAARVPVLVFPPEETNTSASQNVACQHTMSWAGLP